MKKIVLVLILLYSGYASCQLKEGYFQYTIEVTAVDTTQAARQNAGMLFDSRMEIYFAENRSRVNFKMGKLSTTQVVIDRKKNLALSMTSGVMGSYAVQNKVDQLDFNSPGIDSNAVVVKTGEKKVILGFKCEQIILKSAGKVTNYWVTDEIVIDDFNRQMINANVPGFPVSFWTIENGLKMVYQLSNYAYTIEDQETVFSTDPPAGYTLVTQ